MSVTVENEIAANLGGATVATLTTYYDGDGNRPLWNGLVTGAIARASADAYGDAHVPDSLPDRVAYWVADKATVYLIPSAIDYYQTQQRLAVTVDDVTAREYDKVAALQELRKTLNARCLDAWAAVQATISPASESDYYRDVPQVSVDGLLVDPVSRAAARGPRP